ncbi:hypothetical protein [Loigolactobacillus bifermentans]|uniref:Phage protein n=1 Tax=Loigolactobacillus bifermentans DSM 20003 TaxID=1423726 RepID=A0A0R1H2X5_9LACO|nr:hypothetical protein [Loigolactobacillus bifermentans]KRK40830.1 hypothetical protein FC07_GL002580 [Loigolactobacillus bifermentans DSM 20003]QGG59584.1 hypothetical protein LB003_03300 [Loigolactobacillus bifermentans]
MDMTKEALETLQETAVQAAGKSIQVVDGMTFGRDHYGEWKRIRAISPAEEALAVHTLTGLVDYIKTNADRRDKKLTIHVKSETQVLLLSPLDDYGTREVLVDAKPILPAFTYGKFYGSEELNIKLQAGFIDSEDRSVILRVIGNLRDEDVRNYTDDGVSQAVEVKSGIASAADAAVPNPVTLEPYRTFVEIEQPESQFIFRMQKGGMAGLFESDGGMWRNEAIARISDYLADKLTQEIATRYIRIIA